MTTKPKPHVHGRDHEHGGADPTLIHWEDVGAGGSAGGGIQFDVKPQTGGYLNVITEDSSPGIELNATNQASVNIWTSHTADASDPTDTAGDIEVFADGGSIDLFAVRAPGHGGHLNIWGYDVNIWSEGHDTSIDSDTHTWISADTAVHIDAPTVYINGVAV